VREGESALEFGGERSSGGGSWTVEFDDTSHFLASGAQTGATLVKSSICSCWSRSRQRAVLGVGEVSGGRRAGAVS
jgi:hypothetical protein